MTHHSPINRIAGFLLSVLALLLTPCLCRQARAEECVLPAGSPNPCNAGALLDASHFLVPRGWVDKANASAEMVKDLELDLESCEKRLAEKENDNIGIPALLVAGAAAGAVGFAVGLFVGAGL